MGTIASTRVYRNNPPLNTGEGLTILRNNQIGLRELIGSLPPATITSVSSNTIMPTSTMLIVNANATINTITSTVNLSGETTTDNAQAEQEFHDGAVIKIIATSGKTVTIGNSGNVQLLNNASSITVSSTTPTVLTYNATTHKWVEHERTTELVGGIVGNLSSLTTTAKNTVVAAINEVDSNADTNASNHSTLLSAVGNITKSGNNISAISSQITRTSIIAAINDLVSKIGLPLSGLTTSVKSSVVAAINSLVSGKADKTEVGTLSSLTTTTKTSTVAAINELKSTYDSNIGTLTNLTTTNKDSLVSAINELNTGVVHTSGDESVAGDKTFSGTVDLTRTTDAGGTSTNKPALRIGSLSGKHLEFDGDEIMAKNTGNTVGQLNINLDGGLVKIGSGGLTVTGTITGNVTGDLTGTASNATNDVDGNAIKTTYAKLASPTFTGTPKAPTASASTNNTQIATTAFVKTAISNLINSAPTTLDTLNEIATALGNDPNFATTMTTQLGLKANDADVVHKTGDETIAGTKTFSSTVTQESNTQEGFSSKITGNATLRDYVIRDSNDYRISLLRGRMNTNGSRETQLVAIGGSSLNTFSAITVGVTASGVTYANAPSTPSTAATNAIVTKDYADAIDANALHKNVDEEINSNKTFLKNKRLYFLSSLNLSNTTAVDQSVFQVRKDPDTISHGEVCQLNIQKTANTQDYSVVLRVANPRADVLPTAESIANGIDDSDASTSYCWGGIGVWYDYSKNRAYPYCRYTSEYDKTDNSYNHIPTTYWVRHATGDFACNAATATKATQDEDGNAIKTTYAKDANVVHTTGNESIAGNKTFTNDPVIEKGTPLVHLNISDIAKGTNPSSDRVTGIRVYDSQGVAIGGHSVAIQTSGTVRTGLISFKHTANNTSDYGTIYVYQPVSGDPYATAPSTLDTRTNGTDIITRDYLDNHKVEKTSWSSTRLFYVKLAQAVTATSSSTYSLTTSNFGSGYKEIFVKIYHKDAQSTAATIRYMVTFSDGGTIVDQCANGISTNAKNYFCLKVGNDNGFIQSNTYRATEASSGTWNTMMGATNTYTPRFCSLDATITKIEFWSTNSNVTQLPVNLEIQIWGRK